MTGFNLTDLSVTNGTSQDLRENNTFDIVGIAKGDIKVVIPCNTFNGASFVSNEVVVYYNVATGLYEYENDTLSIYPNPSRDGYLIHTTSGMSYSVDIYTADGQFVARVFLQDFASVQFDCMIFRKACISSESFRRTTQACIKLSWNSE